jgi:hypothetical protein
MSPLSKRSTIASFDSILKPKKHEEEKRFELDEGRDEDAIMCNKVGGERKKKKK